MSNTRKSFALRQQLTPMQNFWKWAILTSISGIPKRMIVPSPPRPGIYRWLRVLHAPAQFREGSCHKLIFPPAHRSFQLSVRDVRTARRAWRWRALAPVLSALSIASSNVLSAIPYRTKS